MAGGSWRLAQSLVKLRDEVYAAYPNRSRISDGTIGDAAHQSGASDHNPNAFGVVCALDLTHDPAGGFDAHSFADYLLQNRHSNLKYIVSNGRIVGDWTNWRWVKYNGSDRHDTHIHISVGVGEDGRSAPPYDDQNNWILNGGMNTMSPTRRKLSPAECVDRFRNFAGREDITANDPVCQNRYEDPESDEFLYGLLIHTRDLRVAAQNAANDALSKLAALNLQFNALAQNPTKQQFEASHSDLKKCTEDLQKSMDETKVLKSEAEATDKAGQSFLRWLVQWIPGLK